MHELETGFFVHQPAWHGLGYIAEEGEITTVEEGLIKSGCNWFVSVLPLYYSDNPNTGPMHEVPGHQVVVRDIDNTVLGVVGDRFNPLQNVDAFKFFDPLLENGDFVFDAAGSLQNGKRIWILVRESNKSDYEVEDGDMVRRYLLLAHGHDGTLAVRIGWATIRVVCMNTLQGALRSHESKFLRVKHTKGMHDALDAIQDIVVTGHEHFQATLEQYQRLVNSPCDRELLRKYVRVVFAGPQYAEDETKATQVMGQIVPLFRHVNFQDRTFSPGTTMWDAYNGVTEYLTHYKGKSPDTRLNSNWFGPGASLFQTSLDVAVEMVA